MIIINGEKLGSILRDVKVEPSPRPEPKKPVEETPKTPDEEPEVNFTVQTLKVEDAPKTETPKPQPPQQQQPKRRGRPPKNPRKGDE